MLCFHASRNSSSRRIFHCSCMSSWWQCVVNTAVGTQPPPIWVDAKSLKEFGSWGLDEFNDWLESQIEVLTIKKYATCSHKWLVGLHLGYFESFPKNWYNGHNLALSNAVRWVASEKYIRAATTCGKLQLDSPGEFCRSWCASMNAGELYNSPWTWMGSGRWGGCQRSS